MMDIEVSVAVNFVVAFLYGRLPRRRVHMLAEELDKGIRARCIGHWYPQDPMKGTAYRCIAVTGGHPDPLLLDAAREIALEVAEILPHLPDSLTLWIDPGEVAYRIGEKGSTSTLYSQRSPPEAVQIPAQPADGTSFQTEQHQHQQMQKSSSSLSFFTPAAFAQTKFGSTKLRQAGGRQHGRGIGGGGHAPGSRHGGFSHLEGRHAAPLSGANWQQQQPPQFQLRQPQRQWSTGTGTSQHQNQHQHQHQQLQQQPEQFPVSRGNDAWWSDGGSGVLLAK